MNEKALHETIAALRDRLVAARGPHGHWEGRLSSSALSTATAVFALAGVDLARHRLLVDRGLAWLCENQNADGGWGDTVDSPSNLSTTMLCYSALAIPGGPPACLRCVEKTELWLLNEVGSLAPRSLAAAVEGQYGKDRTFSVPILTMCALAGRLGKGRDAWRRVRPLPFELAVLPPRLFKWLRLPVVSYALPALIAIGQVRYEYRRPANPFTRAVRWLSRARTLRVLTSIQPDNGGFLEAAPLTSFVVMSLAACGRRDHAVVARGVEFLAGSIREDGSWPIDTNLATWGTTLSIGALAAGGLDASLSPSERQRLADWLLSCQYRHVHPYTQAAPGGWAWTNLAGAVPDADDTAGTLVALHELFRTGSAVPISSISAGIEWLLGLQNADGGIPTFCRGWTRLPFDKSAADITAHAVAAMGLWLDAIPQSLKGRTETALGKALAYLETAQRQDGAWVPLWFGNQAVANRENPVYGTSRAVKHLASCASGIGPMGPIGPICERGVRWLLSAQNDDGGWGGSACVASSIEETALAVEALAAACSLCVDPSPVAQSARRGADWLIAHTHHGSYLPASPIGLYFASLWYSEELYPILFALAALSRVSRMPSFPS
ncbi:MAG: squalene--hopene cyclase [Planctomycetes bacterium]|nr:squalene--hopene cyclase [Planctomycetota bacterium]